MSIRIGAIAVAALVAALLVLRWLPLAPALEGAAQPPASRADGADAGAAPAAAPDQGALPELPASLRGTVVDGELTVDASGEFVPNSQALAVFDYFLSATGEEPDDVIRARIVAHLRSTLAPAAAAEAEAFLDTYLRHRERMRTLTTTGTPPADLDRRLQWIREERRSVFGPALAERLFGEEERVVLLDLERRDVVTDAALTQEEKTRRLQEIELRLPEHVREERRRASAPARVSRQVEALRTAGASDAEVFAERERELGPAAAERLAALDRENAAWQARIDAYRAARERILADPSLADADREAQIETLRAERFDERERMRVRALDEVEASTGGP